MIWARAGARVCVRLSAPRVARLFRLFFLVLVVVSLVLHERSAHGRFAGILAEHRSQLCDAVVHCFTGTKAELHRYLDMDCHIGITGWICDERRGLHLRELVRSIPANRLMIETDAPFLTPRDLEPTPKRNEPGLLAHVAAAVAKARGETVEELAASSTATASAFFGLKLAPG